jgi:hypothetical protein
MEEKSTPEKDLEIPIEPEEQVALSVEQLSFGMDEQPAKVPLKAEKPGKQRPISPDKKKPKPAGRKTKTTRAAQATLIAKSAAAQKKAPYNKSSMPGVSKIKSTADQKPSTKRALPKTSKTALASKGKAPVSRPSRPKTSPKSSKEKPTIPVQKVAKTQKTKTTPVPAKKETKAPTRKAPSSSAKAIQPKTKQSAKPVVKPLTRTVPKKNGARKPRQSKMTIKSAETTAKVILPPSWKPPSKKISSTRHTTRSRKPKP